MFTTGTFDEKELTVKSIDNTEDHMSETENEENENDGNENENEENIVGAADDVITLEVQDLQFTDFKVEDLIIVPVLDRHGNIFYFPAIITELENIDETVYIDYLKLDFDNPKILQKHISEKEKNYIIPFKDIVMILPETREIKRDRFIFDRNIRLN